MQNTKRSGRTTRVLQCRSMLTKKTKGGIKVEKVPCPYEVVWRRHTKRGETFWDLDQTKSCLLHRPFCCSGQHVTRAELIADTNFTKHLQEGDNCTGHQAKAFAERDGHRLDGSVHLRTIYRAKADILNQTVSTKTIGVSYKIGDVNSSG